MHLPIFSRPVTAVPYDRIPSDHFLTPDIKAEIIGAPTIVLFGSIFLLAWNFAFPSTAEKILWRIASTYILSFTLLGGIYAQYCEKMIFPRWSRPGRDDLPSNRGKVESLANRLRNIHPSQDPQLDVPLRALVPVSLLCILYCFSRGYILAEDLAGLRKLPADAFQTVSWWVYVPHW